LYYVRTATSLSTPGNDTSNANEHAKNTNDPDIYRPTIFEAQTPCKKTGYPKRETESHTMPVEKDFG
jgi:hypothetical protein